MTLSIIVLAAGKGTRMLSSKPKVFQFIGNLPMLYHVLDKASLLKPKILNLVISPNLDDYKGEIKNKYRNIKFSVQKKQLGTADALTVGLRDNKSFNCDDTLILYGDTPLISYKTIKQAISRFKIRNLDLLVLSMQPENDDNSYGKLEIIDGRLVKIIEKTDLKKSHKNFKICNSGIMIGKTKQIAKALETISNNNKKKEFYLTDIIEIMDNLSLKLSHFKCDYIETLGVNDKVELAKVESEFQKKIRHKFLKKGVTMLDPDTVYFSHDTKIGKNVIIQPFVYFGLNVKISDNVVIKSFSHLENTSISSGASIGPHARIRDNTKIGKNAKIGNFVELKKSSLGKDSKVSHLSYIGDAELQDGVNIGAGTITCNYDGKKKNKTFIGKNSFIGSNTSLIAPLKIKNESTVGAGTVINKDIPSESTVYRKSEMIIKKKK